MVRMVNEEEAKTIGPLYSTNHSQMPVGLPENENENGMREETLFSPRFKSVAAMAGWDEEALLVASLIVEDTPDRNSKVNNKRLHLPNLKSPLPYSRRKRRAQKRSPSTSMPVAVLCLDDEPPPKAAPETDKSATKSKIPEDGVKKTDASDCKSHGNLVSSSNSGIPCIDRLREELSCAICLEICYEPSTTPCGHSFCKRCLRSAADKCGKRCPKCRQLISNGRSCTVNTVLWNTIQLLFPQEVEAKKVSIILNCREALRQSPARISQHSQQNGSAEALIESVSRSPNRRRRFNVRRRSARPSATLSRGDDVVRSINNLPSQDEDAALALRLQREEFMGPFGNQRSEDAPHISSLALARANLRAMASRATSIRLRGRTT